MKEHQITRNHFSERERQVTTATCYVCLTKQIIQNENILLCLITYMGHLNLLNSLFLFHHIHVTFKFREFSAAAFNSLQSHFTTATKMPDGWMQPSCSSPLPRQLGTE